MNLSACVDRGDSNGAALKKSSETTVFMRAHRAILFFSRHFLPYHFASYHFLPLSYSCFTRVYDVIVSLSRVVRVSS